MSHSPRWGGATNKSSLRKGSKPPSAKWGSQKEGMWVTSEDRTYLKCCLDVYQLQIVQMMALEGPVPCLPLLLVVEGEVV